MAQAQEITGLDCDANVLDWADKVLRVRFREILDKREAALERESIEGVHDMRVAIRRLRSALRDFAFLIKKRPLKKLSGDLKKVADALGEARDQDVAIIRLEKLSKKAKAENIKNDINWLIAEQRQLRESAQLALSEKLAAAKLEDLQKRFDKTLSEAFKRKSSAISFNQAGHEVVGQSLREFCYLSASIYEPFIDKPLHKLRLAAKRLRYAIELYTACWGEKVSPFAEGISEMQSLLGEVHDADVWLKKLSASLRHPDKNKAAADSWLLSQFVKRRTKNYRAALKLWNEWQENNFIERLKIVISTKSS